MTGLILRFLITCLGLASLSYCVEPEEHGNVKIGDSCQRDRECIKNAFCRAQLSCQCDPYYSPTPDKSVCIATAGLTCVNDLSCQTMANAECRQGVCACKETFILDINNSSNCIGRPSKSGDPCQRNDECQESLDRASCINGQCRCFAGHRFLNETGQCTKMIGLYGVCQHSYECFLHEQVPDVMECKNNECVCKQGEPQCNKGSLSKLAMVPFFLLLILHRAV